MKKIKVALSGKELLFHPLYNKGSAFTEEERRAFHLTGLLPTHISSMEEQVRRRLLNFRSKPSSIEKSKFLMDLQNRNEVLFYRLLLENVTEMLPYVYTPNVGEIALQYSLQYHQSRGVYISIDQEEEIETILKNSECKEAKIIVVTDGGRVLGLGDIGVGGMAIPIGKLTLYTLFGAIHPENVLPIFLDVGTNNELYLNDPLYMGKRARRPSTERYTQFLDKFVYALKKVYPKVLLQWEDFSREHALPILERYQGVISSFNDDIQGTAATALAGVIAALKLKQGKMIEEKIAIFGGGSAGMGIANLLVDYLVFKGVDKAVARSLIYIIDKDGLVHEGQKEIREEHKPFAKSQKELASWKKREIYTLRNVVKEAKITILIGVSAIKDAFDRKIVKQLAKNTTRPIIFPLSNPNSKSEGEPEKIYRWTKGKGIIAVGSPFPTFTYKGAAVSIPQCNNVYIFPSMGLAASAGNISKITQSLFITAAEALSEVSGPFLFPPFAALRKATQYVAEKILIQAEKEGLLREPLKESPNKTIQKQLWFPEYAAYEADF